MNIKKVKAFLLTLVLTTFTFNFTIAQNSEALARFNVSETEGGYMISWTIKAGFSCYSVDVEHSTDGIYFTKIYTYPGICGGPGTNETYSYLHKSPHTGRNYYRMDMGNYGMSETLSVDFVDTSEKGYVIYPMPIDENSKIRFQQAYNDFSISILSFSGKIIYTEEGISGSVFNLGKLNLQQGTYHFVLSNGNLSYTGTFLKF
ncbi:MAG: T9SS type A sorting domain-containing protein [Bacteroidetes bacterium]|nr:T9SS type A sorting domain-containing protein [Bacteroidota bacterium]